MVCGKEAQYRRQVTQSDHAPESPWRYRNVVLYPPAPPFSLGRLKGGLGTRLTS